MTGSPYQSMAQLWQFILTTAWPVMEQLAEQPGQNWGVHGDLERNNM